MPDDVPPGGGLGIPQASRDAFAMLATADKIPADLADAMKRMVGFRNVAVHDYRALSLPVVRALVADRLGDSRRFAALAIREWG